MTRVTSGKSRRGELALALLLCCFCSVAFGQDKSIKSLLSNLKSADVNVRADAFDQINNNNPEDLQRSDVRAALVDLLDRENRLLHVRPEAYGEGYGVYMSYLEETLAKIVDWRDPHQSCILAEGSYGVDTPFATMLVSKAGAVLIPCLVKLAEGNAYSARGSEEVRATDRTTAIPVLIRIELAGKGLTSADRRQIDKVIDGGLQDSEAGVRYDTVKALGNYGTPEAIPRLQEISRSDPRDLVRDVATKAVQSIQERSKAKTP